MLLNKWIQFAMSLVIVLTGAMSAIDWTAVFSAKTSAAIAGTLGFVKLITNALAPAAGVPTQPTGGSIVTQKTT